MSHRFQAAQLLFFSTGSLMGCIASEISLGTQEHSNSSFEVVLLACMYGCVCLCGDVVTVMLQEHVASCSKQKRN